MPSKKATAQLERDMRRYGVSRYVVFERDNWKCKKCGMGIKEHLKNWANPFDIHHIDGNGIYSKESNNKIDNLMTLCCRCHAKIDDEMQHKKKWGKLAEGDNSEYRFPKIRELIDKEAKKLGGVQKAKRKVAEDLGVSFWTMDTKYYERRSDFCVNENENDALDMEGEQDA